MKKHLITCTATVHAEDKLRMGVVVKIGGIPWFNAMEAGIKSEAEKRGMDAWMIDPNGGFGRVSSVVLSLIALQILSTGFNLMNISQHVSLAMWGAVLIVVLALKHFKSRFNEHHAVKKSRLTAQPKPLVEKRNDHAYSSIPFIDVYELNRN